mmetsp:Transcript_29802/g.62438  ORF Transcript_29802/g.62438 Transcript_29802/m.62438 type:complete len:218 (-) Transcript_29802:712-1365(-)
MGLPDAVEEKHAVAGSRSRRDDREEFSAGESAIQLEGALLLQGRISANVGQAEEVHLFPREVLRTGQAVDIDARREGWSPASPAEFARARLLFHTLRERRHLSRVALRKVRVRPFRGAPVPRYRLIRKVRRLIGIRRSDRRRMGADRHLARRHGGLVSRAPGALPSSDPRGKHRRPSRSSDQVPPPRLQAAILLVGSGFAHPTHHADWLAAPRRLET